MGFHGGSHSHMFMFKRSMGVFLSRVVNVFLANMSYASWGPIFLGTPRNPETSTDN